MIQYISFTQAFLLSNCYTILQNTLDRNFAYAFKHNMTFPEPTFFKLIHTQQHCTEISYPTKLHPNWKMNVKSKDYEFIYGRK